MHLLNTSSLRLHSFIGKVPAYAILSHTWGEEEVTFMDIDRSHAKTMAGYYKIRSCCKQARKDGYDWVWIDTCCIDKRSSTELSEAINSMYKYYWDAEKCYAYLSDVSAQTELEVQDNTRDRSVRTASTDHEGPSGSLKPPESSEGEHSVIKGSRWFKRGWTLQELLAPAVVEFYDAHWELLGTKSLLAHEIVHETNIEAGYILNRSLLEHASIGLRFSWASDRETTREEDIAYCLMGLVQVNMPLLYGEGHKAFFRLQTEILKQMKDHTIFAWQTGRISVEKNWRFPGFFALIAPSPAFFPAKYFMFLQQKPASETRINLPCEMTNVGLRISMPCVRKNENCELAILDCVDGTGNYLAMVLHKRSDGRFQRDHRVIEHLKPSEAISMRVLEIYIVAPIMELEQNEEKFAVTIFDLDLTRSSARWASTQFQLFRDHERDEPRPLQLRELIRMNCKWGISFTIHLNDQELYMTFRTENGQPTLRLRMSDGDQVLEGVLCGNRPGKYLLQWADYKTDCLKVRFSGKWQVEVYARKIYNKTHAISCWQLTIKIRELLPLADQLKTKISAETQ